MASPPFATVSRGAANAVFELALMVHSDSEDIRRFVFENLPVWEALDQETLHPHRATSDAEP